MSPFVLHDLHFHLFTYLPIHNIIIKKQNIKGKELYGQNSMFKYDKNKIIFYILCRCKQTKIQRLLSGFF